MLPNHAPLVIAEQFGTLESLYPGRIDLGLGRAPGTDQVTMYALRRDLRSNGDSFPQDVQELQAYFQTASPSQRVRAVPGDGLNVPIWLLGSSLYSAQLAAALGLPFAFASHFAPDHLLTALRMYREQFQPVETSGSQPVGELKTPYAMAALNVFAADTDFEARRLFTSLQQQFINLRRGRPGPMPPPVDSMDDIWSEGEREMVEHSLAYSVVGGPDTVRNGIREFLTRTGVDELLITAQIYDPTARLRSFEIVSEVRDALNRD